MPRCARLQVAEIPLHIIQRGHNRSPCFYDDADYRVYLAQLGELAHRFQCAVHAYVLMTNHVHLLITPRKAGAASRLMKHLGQRYVQYVNRTYGRTGTLWQGRFRSHPVLHGHYLLACYRYIELNPVRARIVRRPADYPWSSYRVNAGFGYSALITPHEEYLAMGASEYRLTFPAQTPSTELEQIRSAAAGSLPLGNEWSISEIAAIVGRRLQRGTPGRPRRNRGLSRMPEKTGSVPGLGS
jgi:putative transposase